MSGGGASKDKVRRLTTSRRSDRVQLCWGNPRSASFAELLIDCEEDRVLRAVLPPVSNFVVVCQQIENYILARGSRRERCSCIPRSPSRSPSRPPGSAARLGRPARRPGRRPPRAVGRGCSSDHDFLVLAGPCYRRRRLTLNQPDRKRGWTREPRVYGARRDVVTFDRRRRARRIRTRLLPQDGRFRGPSFLPKGVAHFRRCGLSAIHRSPPRCRPRRREP